jgi:hypothetical protein
LLGATALLGAGLVAGCGGDDSGQDPTQVLEETFSGSKDVSSGVIDVSVSAGGESEGEAASFNFTLSGPFEDQGEGMLPAFDLAVSLAIEGGGQDLSFAGGATSTGEQGYLNFEGTDYELDEGTFSSFQEGFESGTTDDSTSTDEDPTARLEELGIDPVAWLTNLQNEGEEDVEGTATIHISGDADIPQIIDDIQAGVEAAGEAATPVPPEQLDQIEGAVSEARFDVYTGVDDKILRRLVLTFAIEVPEELQPGGGSANVDLSVTLSGLNEEQTIEAPADAKPLTELLGQLGGLGALGGLGGLGGLGDLGGDLDLGITPDGSGGSDDGSGGSDDGSGGSDAAPAPDAGVNDAFLDCIAGAASEADFEECAAQFAP